MKRMLFAVALGASAAAAEAAPVPVSGDPVLYWHDVLLAGVPFNSISQRQAAMLSVALYDAVNVTTGLRSNPYVVGTASSGDTRAAAAVAARNVLVNVLPARAAQFDTALSASLALIPESSAKAQGVATGAAIAQAVIAARAGDLAPPPPAYAPSGLPGHWEPTPPANIPAQGTGQAVLTPWVMTSPRQFRPDAPPPIDSEVYAAAYNEIKVVGSATSPSRTAEQTDAALYWGGLMSTVPYVRAALDKLEGGATTPIENARIFALLNTATADAITAAFDAKYAYDYWRPVTAIREGDTDGNPLTEADPPWTPLIPTPPHPSYVSTQAAIAGAASTILEEIFGTDVGFCLTNAGVERCWSSFGAAAAESANSRTWAGVHFGFDGIAGLGIGRGIAEFALVSDAFDDVPTPPALALFGLGALALVVARRRADRRAG